MTSPERMYSAIFKLLDEMASAQLLLDGLIGSHCIIILDSKRKPLRTEIFSIEKRSEQAKQPLDFWSISLAARTNACKQSPMIADGMFSKGRHRFTLSLWDYM